MLQDHLSHACDANVPATRIIVESPWLTDRSNVYAIAKAARFRAANSRTRVLVYQFMRFEFNQRTRLTGGTRKFWDIRCKNFSEASRLYRHNVPYMRVMCPESSRPVMRVRSRCRLQLLELGEDHMRFGSGGIIQRVARGYESAFFKRAHLARRSQRQRRAKTVECSFGNSK